MVTLDLQTFVACGELGPLHRQMSRKEVESHLGQPTSDGGHVIEYGNIGIEYGQRDGQSTCGIQLGFPHPSQIGCEQYWLNPLYRWNVGLVRPNATIDDMRDLLLNFKTVDFIDANPRYTVMEHPETLVHVSFLAMDDETPQTITNVNAVPWWDGGITMR